MSDNSPRRTGSLRDLIYFPVAYYAVGLAIYAAEQAPPPPSRTIARTI